LLLLYGGCQTVETAPATGGCYEHRGMWCSNYAIDPGQTKVAVLAALADSKMPVLQEGMLHGELFIDTRTPEDCEVRLVIMPRGPYGQGARVGVRITGIGTHRDASATRLPHPYDK
jgi:hypothetical protein